MAFRWRKSKSLGKLFRVNLTQNGVGVSVGPRRGGARLNLSPTGRKSISASVPKTGLSWRKELGAGARRSGEPRSPASGRSMSEMWDDIPPDVRDQMLDILDRNADTIVSAFTSENPALDPVEVLAFLEDRRANRGVSGAGSLTRAAVQDALVAAGLQLADGDAAGFGVRDPEKGVIRLFWVNGTRDEREEQVPIAAKALRDAGFAARQMRLGGDYPGVVVKPRR